MEHLDHTDDPLNKAPMLRSLNGAPDPFVVPEGFFERLPHAVQERIVKKERTVLGGIWFRRLALSLGVLALVFAVWWALPRTDEAINGFYDELVLNVDPAELPVNDHLVWEVYADEDQLLFGEVMLELSENELYAYLEYENVDVELLMEEL